VKILKSLVIVLAMAAMVAGATNAYFTASYTVSGNTFSTGTMEFDIRQTNTDTQHLPFSFTGMLPGQIGEDQFNVFNHANSTEMKYRLYFTPTTGDPIHWDKIKFEAYRCNWNVGGSCGNWPGSPTAEGWVKDFDGSSEAASIVSPATIGPNISNYWKFKIWLDTSAGNDYKNATATFDIVGQGTQPSNPGWTE